MFSYNVWHLGKSSLTWACASIAPAPFVENTFLVKFENHCKLWQINTFVSTSLFWCILRVINKCVSIDSGSKLTNTHGLGLIWVFGVEVQIYKYISSLFSPLPFLSSFPVIFSLTFLLLIYSLLFIARPGCRYCGCGNEQIKVIFMELLFCVGEPGNVDNSKQQRFRD